MSEPGISLKWMIFCEDVRREINGKYILIGVYTDNLTTPSFPSDLEIGFFAHGSFDEAAKEVPFRFRILLEPGALVVFSMGATAVKARSEGANAFNFDISRIGIQVQRPGDLVLEFSQHGNQWQEVGRLPVLSSQNPASASGQPS